MAFEEEAAYALASWGRFDASITDQLVLAITSAFVLVAVADGDLASSEIDRFTVLLRAHADVLAPLDIERVDRLFRDLGGALLSEPTAGRQRALACIAAVQGNAVHCELVRSAAEIALAADNRELAAEHEVLGEICKALGIPPR
jgi:tellurite resistance protein